MIHTQAQLLGKRKRTSNPLITKPTSSNATEATEGTNEGIDEGNLAQAPVIELS